MFGVRPAAFLIRRRLRRFTVSMVALTFAVSYASAAWPLREQIVDATFFTMATAPTVSRPLPRNAR